MEFIKELLFPKFCINCQREGKYLCEDCFSLVDFLPYSPKLICAAPYQNFIIKKLITQFKYPPFVKELAKPLASLIIHHLKLQGQQAVFPRSAVLIPVPLTKKRLKERGFNQSGEISKELSRLLGVPLLNNVLLKIKETLPQAELSKKEREENVKGVFSVADKSKVRDKKIFLVDDVFTTGSTMAETTRVLKEAGAKEVRGIAVARE